MTEDIVVRLRQPGTFSEDPLTEILRLRARRLLPRAVEMEVTAFVEGHADLTDEAGRRRIVRHGHLPERAIQTGIGPVAVRCPRVRDRGAGEAGPWIRFTSAIPPPYLRRARLIEELLPWLYLKGISTGKLMCRRPGRTFPDLATVDFWHCRKQRGVAQLPLWSQVNRLIMARLA